MNRSTDYAKYGSLWKIVVKKSTYRTNPALVLNQAPWPANFNHIHFSGNG